MWKLCKDQNSGNFLFGVNLYNSAVAHSFLFMFYIERSRIKKSESLITSQNFRDFLFGINETNTIVQSLTPFYCISFVKKTSLTGEVLNINGISANELR